MITHSTGLAETRSLLEGKQPSDRPNRHDGWCCNQRIIHPSDRAGNYTGSTKWVPGIIRTQLGCLSYEVEVKPGLVWRQHTDQLRDTRIPVTPSINPVTQTSELPIQVESCEDPVPETSEQPATWRLMFGHQVQWMTLQPAVHQIWVSLFLNLFLLHDIRSECRSPQLGWIYELSSDIKTVLISIGMLCLTECFRSLRVTILHALASGEELWHFWPAANTLWACALMCHSKTCLFE